MDKPKTYEACMHQSILILALRKDMKSSILSLRMITLAILGNRIVLSLMTTWKNTLYRYVLMYKPQTDAENRTVAEFIMNSLWGKFAQRWMGKVQHHQ